MGAQWANTWHLLPPEALPLKTPLVLPALNAFLLILGDQPKADRGPSRGCWVTILVLGMLGDYPGDGSQPSINLITKLRPGDNCHGWSATIHWMVTHHPKDMDGHPASPGWSPISLRLVTHSPKSPSQILSPSFPRMVTHDPKHGHPPSKITEI